MRVVDITDGDAITDPIDDGAITVAIRLAGGLELNYAANIATREQQGQTQYK